MEGIKYCKQVKTDDKRSRFSIHHSAWTLLLCGQNGPSFYSFSFSYEASLRKRQRLIGRFPPGTERGEPLPIALLLVTDKV